MEHDPISAIGIIGAGSWGTALAVLLARQGSATRLLARDAERAAQLETERENKRYLEGMIFPEGMSIHSDPQQALWDVDCVIIAVPSVVMREVIDRHAENIATGTLVVSATKGLEIASGKRMSEVIAESISARDSTTVEEAMNNICALSGPNLSVEIAIGLPALATAASVSIETAERIQMMISGERFRVYASEDIIGVELGGTLKNIIAIGAGFIDASGLGANIKAAYVTRGLHEMTRLGLALGAEPATFVGLSGIGDMLTTCYSPLSRNYRLGTRLAEGDAVEEALAYLGQTAEGVPTTRAALRIARQMGVEMPITETAHRVMFEGVPPTDAMTELMRRELQRE
jgi:glycerol-3-phosphate dehydrogenase (NAD(P)+)